MKSLSPTLNRQTYHILSVLETQLINSKSIILQLLNCSYGGREEDWNINSP